MTKRSTWILVLKCEINLTNIKLIAFDLDETLNQNAKLRG